MDFCLDEIVPHGNEWLVPPSPGAGPPLPGHANIRLDNEKLWRQFHGQTTEMIITKLGRLVCPFISPLFIYS